MRKSLYAFALLGMLGLGSCSDDTFNPSVDFGDKTYINDYSSLVNAVNDLNKTLNERFAALNKLIESGVADVKVAINDNTKAIEAQTTILKDSLGSLNNTLLNGFTALDQKIDANGDKLVSAINKQGEVIQLQIKETGELIQGQMVTSTTDIIKALSDSNADVIEKLGAINDALTTGLADLKVSVNNIGSKLDVTNEKLAGIDGSIQAQTDKIGELAAKLLEDFTALNEKIDSNGEKLVNAINKQGEVIQLQIKETGELIQGQIKTSTTDIIKALGDSNADLIEKLGAINEAVTTGLSNLKVAVEGIDGKLEVTNEKLAGIDSSIKDQTDKIGTLASNVLNGFNSVSTKIDSTNANISKLIVSIDKNTTAVTNIPSEMGKELAKLQASMEEQNGKLITAIDSIGHVIAISSNGNSCNVDFTELIAEIGKISGNLTTLEETIAKGDSSIVQALKDYACKCDGTGGTTNVAKNILFEDEDKNDDGTYNTIYVSPSIWNDATKDAIKNQLKTKDFTPTNRQAHCSKIYTSKDTLYTDYLDANDKWVGHAKFVEAGKSDVQVVVNSTIEKDGNQYYECIKVYKYLIYNAKVWDNTASTDNKNCGWEKSMGIYLQDATGGDFNNGRWVYFWVDNNYTMGRKGTWYNNIKITLYNDATGVYLAQPLLNIYSVAKYDYQITNEGYNLMELDAPYDCSGK